MRGPYGTCGTNGRSSPKSQLRAPVTESEDSLESENSRLHRLLAQAGLDAAANDVAHELQKLMVDELHHRVKNTLAMVQAIASQSLRAAASLEDARLAIEQRIRALAAAHDLLYSNAPESTRLAVVLKRAVEAYGGQRQFSIQSPSLDVPAEIALALSMMLNELGTNAVKYGSLSLPTGRVNLVAAVDSDASVLDITWTESGGPRVQPPTRRSFGTRLIENSLSSTIAGSSKLEFPADGVVCKMQIPLSSLVRRRAL
jgi:two-component sensor histidine kinase